MYTKRIAIDLAKNVFQVAVANIRMQPSSLQMQESFNTTCRKSSYTTCRNVKKVGFHSVLNELPENCSHIFLILN